MKLRLFDRMIVPAMLISLFATSALAANGSAEPPFQFYTVLDGLTQSNVVDIEQDQAGYLWFTTARGLNRYDGKEFDQYTIADGLPHNSLTAIHVSATNTVWIGDVRGGVTAIQGAQVIHVIEPFDGKINSVLDIESVDNRMLVVVEGVGIVEITAEGSQLGLKHFIGDESTGITNLYAHHDDIWVESTTGLYRLDIGDTPSLDLLAESVRKIYADATGTLWVADTEGNVGIWRGRKIDPVVEIESDNEIVGIVTDRDNQVWVATTSELFNFDRRAAGSSAVAADVREFSGLDDVTSLFVDRENSIWLSSDSGLMRFLGDRFRHYRLLTKLEPETVWAISEDRYGRFWFGTQTRLIMRQNDESLTVVGEKFGIPKGVVRDIVYDGGRSLWVGITAHGLYHFDVNSMTATHVAESDNANVLDVMLAPDGAVWYSTIGSGVFRYDPNSKSMTRFKSPDDTSVYSLDAGADGSVWYGADEVGLVRLTPDKN
ncbi:MAG: hypothetical protein KJP16_06740, partial [Gammaproteobacteria bacterium]|nr:hypothetical protein [Gammaproteobacteria bacterium]NNL50499.1 hypothetical protein [Woeseiaceae bacterium]